MVHSADQLVGLCITIVPFWERNASARITQVCEAPFSYSLHAKELIKGLRDSRDGAFISGSPPASGLASANAA